MDKTELAGKTLERQLSWIIAADSRAALIVPVSIAMLGTLAAIVPSPIEWSVGAAVLASLATLLLVVSLLCCTLAAFPRTNGPKGSLIFFGGISERDIDSYVVQLLSCELSELQADLARQCYVNATIASKKFRWVKTAMGFLFGSILPWVGAVYLLYQR